MICRYMSHSATYPGPFLERHGTTPPTFINAFAKIKARSDFETLSAKRLGKYPMYIGVDAKTALGNATTVSASAKSYVIDWLKADFGVDLKK